jgi:hypothetical protein
MSIEKKLSIVYTDEPTFKYANGAFGSVNGNGDLTINFYVDRPKNYETFTLRMNEQTKQLEQVFDGDDTIREVHTRIILNINTAKSVAEWIENNLKAYEEMIDAQVKE